MLTQAALVEVAATDQGRQIGNVDFNLYGEGPKRVRRELERIVARLTTAEGADGC